ncbi:hypothetical protein [Streptomyces sp. CBMA29]|uniref:hypothetical protein n=1 Tax=Streptomyces sp. CBMA29 TaxID=1896314 RepID=UPI001661A826|nr:hypothetical protein [Streptomyces sp. CBMA29]MBD0734035.1 hypothetical protein [Streptomyces sp. CBMA29]
MSDCVATGTEQLLADVLAALITHQHQLPPDIVGRVFLAAGPGLLHRVPPGRVDTPLLHGGPTAATAQTHVWWDGPAPYAGTGVRRDLVEGVRAGWRRIWPEASPRYASVAAWVAACDVAKILDAEK